MVDHFQNTEIVNFKLKDGSEFGYKPMTAGEENDYIDEYIEEKEVIIGGKKVIKRVQNISKLNKVKMYNLVKTPYNNWDNLSKSERWNLLKSLKPEIFSEIITNINSIGNNEKLKKK